MITDKNALRALVVLRVLARYAAKRAPLPIMFTEEHTEDNLFNTEWKALGIDVYYPHGIKSRYQFFYAAHWLHDHGYLSNLPSVGRWKRDAGYYTPTTKGYKALAQLGEDWTQWKVLPPSTARKPTTTEAEYA